MAHTHTPIKKISDIKPGDHLCCIYSTEDEHRTVITQYLRAGLEQNEKIFYIVDARTKDMVINYLKNDGLDVEYYLKKGQFAILTIADAYMKGGVFDPDKMIVLLTSETKKALDEGYSALRVTGEMSWALRGLPGSERLIEYENKLNTFFPGSKCLAICQYDRRCFDAEILLNILLTHPFAFTGANLYDNFYYTAPEDIPKPKQSEMTLNHWIINIIHRQETEEALRESEEKYRTLFENMQEGFAYCRMIYDERGRPEDFIYLNINAAFDRIIGTTTVVNKRVTEVFPGIREAFAELFEIYGRVALTGKPEAFDLDFKPSGKWLHISVYSPAKEHFVAAFEDITKRKRAEEELKESEIFLTNIVEQIPDMIFVKDARDLRFVRLNKAGEDLLGYSRAEVLGKNDYDLFPNDEAVFFTGNDREVLLTNQLSDNPAEKIQTRYKGERILHTKKIPIIDEKGDPRYLLGISEDITDRKQSEDALRETKDYLENLIRYANVPIVSWNPELKITEFNRAFEQLNGMTREGVIGQPLAILFTDKTREKFMALIRRALRGEHWEVVEIPIRHVSGETRIVLWNSTNILDPTGKVIATIAQGQDITERKAAAEAIRTLGEDFERKVAERTSDFTDINLKLMTEIEIRLDGEKQLTKTVGEKEVLLREVHHRVKNNLQIIISLLNLQSRYITDETTRSAFRESQNRIRAMALVHEKLYQSTDLAKLDLGNYIRFLGDNLFQFLGMKGKGITLTMDIRDIFLAIDTAIPIGLIINELISNSLKYAFPGGRNGEISVAIHRQDRTLTILFQDNGVGIPEDFDWRDARSLGLRLVISLVEQLDGTIDLDRSAGTVFKIVVKEKE